MPQPQEKLYTSKEFAEMTDLPATAELINGKIVLSASPTTKHQDISVGISSEILFYIRANKGKCKVYTAPLDVILTDDATVQPDVFVVCNEDNITDKGINGCPDWIIEILSPSSVANDFYYKKNLYFENGVREYWIVDPMKETVLVFDKPTTSSMYSFDDEIPVGIYDGKLKICINKVI